MSDIESKKIDRRQFIASAGFGAAALGVHSEGFLKGPKRLSANAKVNIAGIGIGSQGGSDVDGVANEGHNIVALCDVDSKYAAKKFAQYPNAKQRTES